MPKDCTTLSTPNNISPSDFNLNYVEPLLKNAVKFANRFAPSDGEIFFEYVLLSKNNSAQGSIEKHQRIALAYFELPTLDKNTLFPIILKQIDYLDPSVVIALFTSTHKTHPSLLFYHPSYTKLSLLSGLIHENANHLIIQFLINTLDESNLYFDVILKHRPLVLAARKASLDVINYLNNRNVIDLPDIPHKNERHLVWIGGQYLVWTMDLDNAPLFAVELIDDPALLNALQLNTHLFFEILNKKLQAQQTALKIADRSILIDREFIINLINKLLTNGYKILPNVDDQKTALALLYHHTKNTKKGEVLDIILSKDKINNVVFQWFSEIVINQMTSSPAPIEDMLILKLIERVLANLEKKFPRMDEKKALLTLLYLHSHLNDKENALRIIFRKCEINNDIFQWVIEEIINPMISSECTTSDYPLLIMCMNFLIEKSTDNALSLKKEKFLHTFERLYCYFLEIKNETNNDIEYTSINQIFYNTLDHGAIEFLDVILKKSKKFISPLHLYTNKPILLYAIDRHRHSVAMWEIIQMLLQHGFCCGTTITYTVCTKSNKIKLEIRTAYAELLSMDANKFKTILPSLPFESIFNILFNNREHRVIEHRLINGSPTPQQTSYSEEFTKRQESHTLANSSLITQKRAYTFPDPIVARILSFLQPTDAVNYHNVYFLSEESGPINQKLRNEGIITDTQCDTITNKITCFYGPQFRTNDIEKAILAYAHWCSALYTIACTPLNTTTSADNKGKNIVFLMILNLLIYRPIKQLPVISTVPIDIYVDLLMDNMLKINRISKEEIELLLLEYYLTLSEIKLKEYTIEHLRDLFGNKPVTQNYLTNYLTIMSGYSHYKHFREDQKQHLSKYAIDVNYLSLDYLTGYYYGIEPEDLIARAKSKHLTFVTRNLISITTLPDLAMYYYACWPIFMIYHHATNQSMNPIRSYAIKEAPQLFIAQQLDIELINLFFKYLKTYICNYDWPKISYCCFFTTGVNYQNGLKKIFVPTEVHTQLEAIDNYFNNKAMLIVGPQEANSLSTDYNMMTSALISVFNAGYQGFNTRLTVKSSPSQLSVTMRNNPENTYFLEFTTGSLFQTLWNRMHPKHRPIEKALREVYYRYQQFGVIFPENEPTSFNNVTAENQQADTPSLARRGCSR